MYPSADQCTQSRRADFSRKRGIERRPVFFVVRTYSSVKDPLTRHVYFTDTVCRPIEAVGYRWGVKRVSLQFLEL